MPSGNKERHRTEAIGWLRAAVLGANDGILSTSSAELFQDETSARIERHYATKGETVVRVMQPDRNGEVALRVVPQL